MSELLVNTAIRIPLTEFSFSFARSSGPGGQNVNKVNTKVTLRWHVIQSRSVSETVRDRFRQRFGRRINKEGEVVLHSQRYRDQGRNVADCLAKLRSMLEEVATAPQRRIPSRRTRASVEKRLRDKRRASQKKQHRRRPHADE